MISKPTYYDTKEYIRKGDLMIAVETDYDLTGGRVYRAITNQGDGTFGDCVFVINDKGIKQDYSSEYFCKYEGEIVREH